MTGPKNRCPLCGMGVVVTKHNGIRRHCKYSGEWCEVHGVTMQEALRKYVFPPNLEISDRWYPR